MTKASGADSSFQPLEGSTFVISSPQSGHRKSPLELPDCHHCIIAATSYIF
jgi:hypothetical protein